MKKSRKRKEIGYLSYDQRHWNQESKVQERRTKKQRLQDYQTEPEVTCDASFVGCSKLEKLIILSNRDSNL